MKQLNLYISEKLKIDKETSVQDDQITKDFKQLMKQLKEEDAYEEVTDELYSMMEFDDDDYDRYYYKFDDEKWFYFLRSIVNYDMIVLDQDGTININKSNHKEIAKMIDKYNKPEIGKKVWASFKH